MHSPTTPDCVLQNLCLGSAFRANLPLVGATLHDKLLLLLQLLLVSDVRVNPPMPVHAVKTPEACGNMCCRATAEQAGLPQPPARRMSKDKPSAGTGPSSLPPRHPTAGTQSQPHAAPTATSNPGVQPVLPRSARRSLLGRQAAQTHIQQQQPLQEATTPAADVVSSHAVPHEQLDAIPEGVEESVVQHAPEYGQQTAARSAGHASGTVDQLDTATVPPVLPSAALAHAAAHAEPLNQADKRRSSEVASPTGHDARPRLASPPSKSGRHYAASVPRLPASVQEAVPEAALAAAAPLPLLQLAQAALAQQQQRTKLSSAHEQSLVEPVELHQKPADRQSMPVEVHPALRAGRGEVGGEASATLQELHASLAQTLTSTVESAMTHLR